MVTRDILVRGAGGWIFNIHSGCRSKVEMREHDASTDSVGLSFVEQYLTVEKSQLKSIAKD